MAACMHAGQAARGALEGGLQDSQPRGLAVHVAPACATLGTRSLAHITDSVPRMISTTSRLYTLWCSCVSTTAHCSPRAALHASTRSRACWFRPWAKRIAVPLWPRRQSASTMWVAACG
mmetsp:Transcript_16494/g.42223  ORF Transcript_16494/g.42223 Transcript_16494/m.42223 type:complete len:119 (-) Transcript_16494:75-431(-)